MSLTSDALFTYLREIFYARTGAELDVDMLEEDYVPIGQGLMYFAQCLAEYYMFANALSKGDLSAKSPPPENELAAPLKSLHASLKHLTWQTQQVSKGDYKQRVDFMGEFADAFNTMVGQLSDRQKKLEDEIAIGKKHEQALEQSNLLLNNLTHYIPQQIFVISVDDHEVLLYNDMAEAETKADPGYIEKLVELLPDAYKTIGAHHFEVKLYQGEEERYLDVSTYTIQWNDKNAAALIISDVSVEKKQLRELEGHAYRDDMTGMFNRFYGMLSLNGWLSERRKFSLIFVDMDNLKYINDVYGHSEGDSYINSVARHLSAFSHDAMVCRVGGDEFMLMAPNLGAEETLERMNEIQREIQNDEYLKDKAYYYSVSYGIVCVDEKNELSSSAVLSLADERMYEQKRTRKKERRI